MRILLPMILVACGSRSPTPRTETACRGVTVNVTPPSDADRAAGNLATLRGSFAGDGMGAEAEWICLDDGSQRRSIHHTFETAIRASATELQRVTIQGTPVLIGVQPGGVLSISYHPCANWQLFAAWLDSGTMNDGVAVKRADACPDGLVDGGEIHEADDPHCGADVEGECVWRRCVRGATIGVDASAPRELVITADVTMPDFIDRVRPGESVPIAPYGGFCPSFEAIDAGTEHVRIAPGRGERWQLTVDAAGRVVGRLL
jgi:hypothetical protein